MKAHQLIVTRLPLSQLWNQDGPLPATRGNQLDAGSARLLLQEEGVRLVRADIGEPLEWIPHKDRFHFWKTEVIPHLVPTSEQGGFRLEDYPNDYCYIGTEWRCPEAPPIILFEKHH